MRVVFDTNVLISGFLTTTGLCERALNMGLKRHAVILSEFILKEFGGKLHHKLEVPSSKVEYAVTFLKKRTLILDILNNPKIEFSDRKDIPILSLIEAAKPHYLITGDKRLLGLKKFGSTLIISTREGVEVL